MDHNQLASGSHPRQKQGSHINSNAQGKSYRFRPGMWLVMVASLVLLETGCQKKEASQSANAAGTSRAGPGFPKECLAALDEIRKAGYPATPEELDQWYTAVPAGENAAEVYTKAFAQLALSDRKDPALPIVGGAALPAPSVSLPASMTKAISGYVAQNQVALDLLYEAGNFHQSRFPVDLKPGLAALLPYLRDVRASAQLLSLQSMLATEKGDPDLAVKAILAQLHLASSLQQEPLLISQLVRLASIGLAKNTLERLLSRTPLSDEQLQALLTGFEAAEQPASLTRAIIGERCMVIDSFRTLPKSLQDSKMLSEDLRQSIPADYQKQPVFIQDFEKALKVFESLIAAREKPLPQALEIEGELETAVAEAREKKLLLTAMFTPAIGKMFTKEAEHIATVRAARTALAIQRYRLGHRDFLPKSIEELAPKFLKVVPSDPFTGQPLLFKARFSKAYVVYSVGKDREDNGGTEKKSGVENASYDITFVVAR